MMVRCMEMTPRMLKDECYGVFIRLHPLRERLLALEQEAPSYELKEHIASAAGDLLNAIESLGIFIRKIEQQLGEE